MQDSILRSKQHVISIVSAREFHALVIEIILAVKIA